LSKKNGGVDLVIEMLANVNLEKDMNIVKKQGIIVIVGSRGKIEIAPRDIMMKESWITGVALNETSEGEKEEIMARIIAGLGNGTLVTHVGKTYDLAEASKAHDEIINGKSLGKIVLQVST